MKELNHLHGFKMRIIHCWRIGALVAFKQWLAECLAHLLVLLLQQLDADAHKSRIGTKKVGVLFG